ncbi:MAG: c-type cytochrome [Candidatus Aminicenantes bacterium]|nr:c-type cytochrome [Candidatus Aminicenantes bacterium]
MKMTVYLLKSIIALFFLAGAFSAAVSMLALMGRTEKKANPERWRRFHRLAGYLFAVFLLALSAMGISIFVRAGDSLPLRAVIHAFIGLFILAVFFLKWLIARFYRQFLRMMPALGLTVFVLALVMFSMAGYFFLRAAASAPLPGEVSSAALPPPLPTRAPADGGIADRGALLYAKLCASCHYADRAEGKQGPGLKGLFSRSSLPYSGKPATEENIRRQLVHPARSMPSFSRLSAQELADLMAYLKTL